MCVAHQAEGWELLIHGDDHCVVSCAYTSGVSQGYLNESSKGEKANGIFLPADMFRKQLPLKLSLPWRIWPALENLYGVLFNLLQIYKKSTIVSLNETKAEALYTNGSSMSNSQMAGRMLHH